MASKCDEDSHPREWILFESIDVDGDQILQKEEVEAYFGGRWSPPLRASALPPASCVLPLALLRLTVGLRGRPQTNSGCRMLRRSSATS
jgi:hypothetical protein